MSYRHAFLLPVCGIVGQVAFPNADSAAVERMAAALRHRGPDGIGFYHEGPVSLGHTRLSIIDIEGGKQPQFNEDGTIAVVFNGEIYNYKELIVDLQTRHIFRTSSDTEVLVHLYEEEGPRMLSRLRGMFAFAVWDARKRQLFAARDRFGKKPFYYCRDKGGFWFASELGALVTSGAQVGGVDSAALSDFLELLYIPSPRTIRTGIKKLPPGSMVTVTERDVSIESFWRPPSPGSAPDLRFDPRTTLRKTLEEATRLRLRSDVPLGALLSGGIDSSAVVGLMAQELGPGVKTYSVGFGRSDDELPFARMVADRHRTDHHEIMVVGDVAEWTARALSAFSEPFGDSSAVPTIAVFREVAKHVKVVLTGEGGDELFAGYDRYRRMARLPHIRAAQIVATGLDRAQLTGRGASLRRAARLVGSTGGPRYRAMIEVFSAAERANLLGRPAPTMTPMTSLPSQADSALAFDLGVYLPDDLLVKTDISAMHWGLEARCPLLDHVLAEQIVPLGADQKQDGQSGKLLLREAIRDLVPAPILTRKKRGFGSPVGQWLQGPLKPMVLDLLGSPGARIRQWMDGRVVDRTVGNGVHGKTNPHQAWALLALELWAKRWDK